MTSQKVCIHRDNTWIVFGLGVVASFIASLLYDMYKNAPAAGVTQ